MIDFEDSRVRPGDLAGSMRAHGGMLVVHSAEICLYDWDVSLLYVKSDSHELRLVTAKLPCGTHDIMCRPDT